MINRRQPRDQRRTRCGAVALEFVIVALIFVITIMGIVEISRAIMVYQVMVNAAREGTRRAVVPGATDAEVTGADGIVAHYLAAAGIPATFDVSLLVNGTEASLSTAASRDEITVHISVPYSDVSWGIMNIFSESTTLQSAVVMRKE